MDRCVVGDYGVPFAEVVLALFVAAKAERLRSAVVAPLVAAVVVAADSDGPVLLSLDDPSIPSAKWVGGGQEQVLLRRFGKRLLGRVVGDSERWGWEEAN